MKKLLASSLLAFSLLSTTAYAWDIDKMNAQIDATNVIVAGKCSGTIISKEQRLVLTAFHCVKDLFQEVTEKQVNLVTQEVKDVTIRKIIPLTISVNKVADYAVVSTNEYAAKVVGADDLSDTALIQVTDVDYVPKAAAPMADAYDFKRGRKVYAVGNPAIRFDNSVTEGIISNSQRTINIEELNLKVFQHSATIIGGNSGGAIYNDDGQIIGTVSAGLHGAAISFAVPIEYSKAMITKAGFGNILHASQ